MLYDHTIHAGFFDKENFLGISRDFFQHTVLRAHDLMDEIATEFKAGALPWLELPNQETLASICEIAEQLKGRYKNILILGMGGASLCGQVLVSLMRRPFAPYGKMPRIYFVDTLDPSAITDLYCQINPRETAFVVISKSGTTVETLTQLSLFYTFTKEVTGAEPQPGQFMMISDPKPSPLRDFAEAIKARVEDHRPEVGGRFAIFTNVGLLPAAIASMNIQNVCEGANETLAHCLKGTSQSVIEGAAMHVVMLERGIQQSVMMSYSDGLLGLVDWVRQLIAESLGKGGKGITPIKAKGTMDQHSQLQLFLDGPKDKWFTVLRGVPIIPHLEIEIPKQCKPWDNGLVGSTLAEVVEIEYQATVNALLTKGCPLRTINCGYLDEYRIGALAMHFMLETMLVAKLMNINAYDQPAVEIGKRFALDLLAQKARERTHV
ncbi:MAG: hypothetical protein IPP74_06150 [Alphaproteobacteria bacterium]|nr:hypothetical protein [Alphaproteobacteria bacterium]